MPQTGPMSTSERPSPTRMFLTRCNNFFVNTSNTLRTTMARLVDVHHCPAQAKAALATLSTEMSRSASSRTTAGFLPPSSSCVRVRDLATLCCILFPVSVDPVNEIASTMGFVIISSPTVEPPPVIRFRTPRGRPASIKRSTNAFPALGVKLAGFMTTVLPLINAGVHFRPGTLKGKFHGQMIETAPNGRRMAYAKTPFWADCAVSPHIESPCAI